MDIHINVRVDITHSILRRETRLEPGSGINRKRVDTQLGQVPMLFSRFLPFSR
jgi:hypothetical protein